MTLEEYQADLTAKGYGPAAEKHWVAGTHNPGHTHEKDLYVWVLEGTFILEMDGQRDALGPGGSCEVPGGHLHAERTGPEGARFLVATR